MAYATIAAMQKRFGEQELIYLSERDNAPADVINTAVIEQAITNTTRPKSNSYHIGQYILSLELRTRLVSIIRYTI